MGAKLLKRWLVIGAAGVAVGLTPVLIGRTSSPSSDAPTGVLVATSTIPLSSPARVSSIADGDTLRLRDGRRVRLVQIDAPEVGECYATASGRMLARRLPPGTEILLARDEALDDRDDYGRLLRYVFVLPLNINVELVSAGAAVPYFFRGRRGTYADELVAAAKEARRGRRGLWGACPGARLDPRRGALTGPGS